MRHGALVLAFALAGCWEAHDLSLREKYGVHGLITDPSPAQLKAGALSAALDVVFRRPNTAEPRPGFTTAYETDLDAVRKLIPFDGSLLTIGFGTADVTGVRTLWSTDAGNDVTTEDGTTALDWDITSMRGVVARKNLYLTTSDAVRKLTAADELEAERAGMVAPVISGITNSGAQIGDDERVAYRATFKRRDANGVEVESAPSPRAIVENQSGSPTGARVTVYLYDDVQAGDTIALYRSFAVPNTLPAVPDALFLVKEYEITSADITAERVSIDDAVADADVGRSLYTNPTREGIERRNARPPLARDLALFQGSLFAANITYPPLLKLRYSQSGNVTGQATGIGRRTYTGTRTSASNQITGLSATTGLKVGMLLSSSASWSAAPVRITAIAGSDLTMSATWGGATDGAPASLTFHDSIRISNAVEDKYYGNQTVTDFLVGLMVGKENLGVDGVTESAAFRAYTVNDSIYTIDGVFQTQVRREIVIETLLPSGGDFEVWATHGDEYEPPLPEPTVADGEPSVATAIPNGLSWSKQDQPEHFLLSALWYVGRETSPILRIVPTRDSLMILKGKGDGIYRLTGFGERSGWRVDPVAEDTYLLHPDLALETDGRVFAWTNKGLVEVTDAGVSPPLNAPIANATSEQERTLDGSATDFYAFAVANTKDSELLFGLANAEASSEEGVSKAHVYNTRTGAWSHWFSYASVMTTMAYDPSDGLLYYGLKNSADVRGERDPSGDVVNADASHVVTISALTSATGRITFSSTTWTPALGDLVEAANGTKSVVVALEDATHCVLQSVAGMNTGDGAAYSAFTSGMTWQPDTGGSSAAWKRYTEQVTHFDDTYGLARWRVSFANEYSSENRDYTMTLQRSTHPRGEKRATPTRATAMAQHLTTSVSITSADARWRITGIALGAEAGSLRSSR